MTENEMRQRFAQLQGEVNSILAVSGPLRDQYTAASQQAEAQLKALAEQFQAAEAGLFEKQQELAAIARYLNGKTSLEG